MGRVKRTPEEREARRLAERSRSERWSDALTVLRDGFEAAKEDAESLKELLAEKVKDTADDANDEVEVEVELNIDDVQEDDEVDVEQFAKLGNIQSILDNLSNEELADVVSEYESWRDGMPESFQSSPTYEKLDEVCSADIEFDIPSVPELDGLDESTIDDFIGELDEQISMVDELENIELPRGFGRD